MRDDAPRPGWMSLPCHSTCVCVLLLQPSRTSLCDFVTGGFVVTLSFTGPRKRFREMNAAHVGGHG